MLVHAFLQDQLKKDYVLDAFGITTKFVINDEGHCVGDVTDVKLLQRLMQIPEGFCLYEDKSDSSEPKDPNSDGGDSKYKLISDGETVDLGTMDRSDLLAFIETHNLNYAPRAATPDDKIRDKIVALLTEA